MLLGLTAIALYFCAAGVIATRLFHHQGPSQKLFSVLALIAVCAHAFILSDAILVEPGQNMSILNVASLIALIIALTMTVASFALPNIILLPVVYGFAGLIVLFGLVIPDTYIMQIGVQPALLLHITLALFAYGCLMIAFLYALQLAYINSRLKQKQASLLHSSLPPLLAVENILFKLLLTGTILLTLSLASGFLFLEDMFAQDQAHKTILSLLAWLVFGLVLIGHKNWGWRGKPVISATIVGSILLTLAYFGSRVVREVIIG